MDSAWVTKPSYPCSYSGGLRDTMYKYMTAVKGEPSGFGYNGAFQRRSYAQNNSHVAPVANDATKSTGMFNIEKNNSQSHSQRYSNNHGVDVTVNYKDYEPGQTTHSAMGHVGFKIRNDDIHEIQRGTGNGIQLSGINERHYGNQNGPNNQINLTSSNVNDSQHLREKHERTNNVSFTRSHTEMTPTQNNVRKGAWVIKSPTQQAQYQVSSAGVYDKGLASYNQNQQKPVPAGNFNINLSTYDSKQHHEKAVDLRDIGMSLASGEYHPVRNNYVGTNEFRVSDSNLKLRQYDDVDAKGVSVSFTASHPYQTASGDLGTRDWNINVSTSNVNQQGETYAERNTSDLYVADVEKYPTHQYGTGNRARNNEKSASERAQSAADKKSVSFSASNLYPNNGTQQSNDYRKSINTCNNNSRTAEVLSKSQKYNTQNVNTYCRNSDDHANQPMTHSTDTGANVILTHKNTNENSVSRGNRNDVNVSMTNSRLPVDNNVSGLVNNTVSVTQSESQGYHTSTNDHQQVLLSSDAYRVKPSHSSSYQKQLNSSSVTEGQNCVRAEQSNVSTSTLPNDRFISNLETTKYENIHNVRCSNTYEQKVERNEANLCGSQEEKANNLRVSKSQPNIASEEYSIANDVGASLSFTGTEHQSKPSLHHAAACVDNSKNNFTGQRSTTKHEETVKLSSNNNIDSTWTNCMNITKNKTVESEEYHGTGTSMGVSQTQKSNSLSVSKENRVSVSTSNAERNTVKVVDDTNVQFSLSSNHTAVNPQANITISHSHSNEQEQSTVNSNGIGVTSLSRDYQGNGICDRDVFSDDVAVNNMEHNVLKEEQTMAGDVSRVGQYPWANRHETTSAKLSSKFSRSHAKMYDSRSQDIVATLTSGENRPPSRGETNRAKAQRLASKNSKQLKEYNDVRDEVKMAISSVGQNNWVDGLRAHSLKHSPSAPANRCPDNKNNARVKLNNARTRQQQKKGKNKRLNECSSPNSEYYTCPHRYLDNRYTPEYQLDNQPIIDEDIGDFVLYPDGNNLTTEENNAYPSHSSSDKQHHSGKVGNDVMDARSANSCPFANDYNPVTQSLQNATEDPRQDGEFSHKRDMYETSLSDTECNYRDKHEKTIPEQNIPISKLSYSFVGQYPWRAVLHPDVEKATVQTTNKNVSKSFMAGQKPQKTPLKSNLRQPEQHNRHSSRGCNKSSVNTSKSNIREFIERDQYNRLISNKQLDNHNRNCTHGCQVSQAVEISNSDEHEHIQRCTNSNDLSIGISNQFNNGLDVNVGISTGSIKEHIHRNERVQDVSVTNNMSSFGDANVGVSVNDSNMTQYVQRSEDSQNIVVNVSNRKTGKRPKSACEKWDTSVKIATRNTKTVSRSSAKQQGVALQIKSPYAQQMQRRSKGPVISKSTPTSTYRSSYQGAKKRGVIPRPPPSRCSSASSPRHRSVKVSPSGIHVSRSCKSAKGFRETEVKETAVVVNQPEPLSYTTKETTDTSLSHSRENLFDIDNMELSSSEFQHFKEMDRKMIGRMSKWQLGALLKLSGLTLAPKEVDQLWGTLNVAPDGMYSFSSLIKHFVQFKVTGTEKKEEDSESTKEQIEQAKKIQRERKERRKAEKDAKEIEEPRRPISTIQQPSPTLSQYPPPASAMSVMSTKSVRTKELLVKIKQDVVKNWEGLKSVFKFIDKSGFATVTLLEMKEVMDTMNFNLTREQKEELCQRFDLQRNGRFHYLEFMKCFSQRPSNGERAKTFVYSKHTHKLERKQCGRDVTVANVLNELREKFMAEHKNLRRAFKKLDIKRKGYLSVQDFRKALRACDVDVSNEDFYHLMTAFDRNITGRISYDNFISTFIDV